jgi:hypothetical protein
LAMGFPASARETDRRPRSTPSGSPCAIPPNGGNQRLARESPTKGD